MADPHETYQGKYRIPSARAAWWDYGWAGAYFITICTRDRKPYFGSIEDGEMRLSQVGVLADVFWHQIPQHGRNLRLGPYVVMPNHMHGILILDRDVGGPNHDPDDVTVGDPVVETRHALSLQQPQQQPDTDPETTGQDRDPDGITPPSVETRHALSLQYPQPSEKPRPKTPGESRFQNPGKNTVSTIVGGYKSAVTRHARRLGYAFGWQARFHDHIIRDAASYQRIADYINNNIANWREDKYFE